MNGEDLMPSTCIIMALTTAQIRQVYDIRNGVRKRDARALSAFHSLLGYPKYLLKIQKRRMAMYYLDEFIAEIERYR